MTYRERRLARAQRLAEWADKREQKSSQARQAIMDMTEDLPLGQPTLVGHHSERKMRRYRSRLDASMRASIENGQKAKEFRQRAAGIEEAAQRAIYNDDPDAVERLSEKLAGLEAQRNEILAYNRSCRQGAPDPALLGAQQRKGLELLARATSQMGANGALPPYLLANLSGNIMRARGRLEKLRQSQVNKEQPHENR
jgi:Domain of unknown function (DUF3560)